MDLSLWRGGREYNPEQKCKIWPEKEGRGHPFHWREIRDTDREIEIEREIERGGERERKRQNMESK